MEKQAVAIAIVGTLHEGGRGSSAFIVIDGLCRNAFLLINTQTPKTNMQEDKTALLKPFYPHEQKRKQSAYFHHNNLAGVNLEPS